MSDKREYMKRLNGIEERLSRIENDLRLILQNQQIESAPWNIPKPSPTPWNEPKSVCSKCGMEFSSITGYACMNMSCPMGLGPKLY
jgi:hypothetical protein